MSLTVSDLSDLGYKVIPKPIRTMEVKPTQTKKAENEEGMIQRKVGSFLTEDESKNAWHTKTINGHHNTEGRNMGVDLG